jgi:hypothetical protein
LRNRLTAIMMAVVGIGATATSTSAAEATAGFVCTFKAGTTLGYAAGKYRRTIARPLAFDVEAIDLEGQKAELVTSRGRGTLRVVRALNANHYLEVVAEGFLNLTTIYDRDAKAGAHPAVHSRHFGLFGEPVVAQYHGFCLPK